MGGIKAHMNGELNLLQREVMPVFNFNLRTKNEIVRIVPLGCLHYGHRASLVSSIDGFIQYILQTPDAYTILMGDLIENVLPETAMRHGGSMWEQSLTPDEQRAMAIRKLKPLADAGKILFAIAGNHQVRTWRLAGIHPEALIAEALGVPFSPFDALANITIGKQIYTIHAIHGGGATADPGAVIKKIMMQQKRFQGADIYLRGHHHAKAASTTYHFDAATGQPRKVFFVGTGSFLGYLDTYAYRGEMAPAVPGAVKVKLYKSRFDIHITI